MTLPLPVHDGENLQFILDRIAGAHIDTGGRQIKLRFGIGNATWTASTTSATVGVTHGLGSAPVCVLIVTAPGGGTAAEAMWRVNGTTATTFTCDGTRPAAFTGDSNFYWLAIG